MPDSDWSERTEGVLIVTVSVVTTYTWASCGIRGAPEDNNNFIFLLLLFKKEKCVFVTFRERVYSVTMQLSKVTRL